MKDHRVHFFSTENDDTKSSAVERFNRTLKCKMWRYFTYTRKKRYVDTLDDLVLSYNSSKHRPIRMSPSDEIHLTGRCESGLKEIQYPLSWFNTEEWVGNFTVDATNVADIENDHKVVYGMKLPVGYYSSPTKRAEKITETCLVSMPYDLNECINVTINVVTGKFTMRLLEGVRVQFQR